MGGLIQLPSTESRNILVKILSKILHVGDFPVTIQTTHMVTRKLEVIIQVIARQPMLRLMQIVLLAP
jgi:hypothetical protein